MRRLAVVVCAAGASIVALACGGPPFALGTSGDDAADATDVVDATHATDAADATGVNDASAATDVTVGDAPIVAHDAGHDVVDAPISDAVAETSTPDAADDAAPRDAAPRDAIAFDAVSDVVDEPSPHCGSGFACAPAVPSGWNGPFELYAGAGAPPSCEASFSGGALDDHGGLDAPPATCSCACGQATGVTCPSPALTFYATSATCSLAASCATFLQVPGACAPSDVSSACGSLLGVVMSVPRPTASLGSCAPVATTSVPAASWTTQARACGASLPLAQADCAAGSVCAPTPSSPFGPSLCIEQAGDVAACPPAASTDVMGATGYTSRSVYYGAVDDARGCSACTCGAVAGASCTGNVTQFASTDTTCQNGGIIYPLGATCASIQQPANLEVTVSASGGSCVPSPTVGAGAASASKPVTFCCTP